jgi:signal transduction histidine kinase
MEENAHDGSSAMMDPQQKVNILMVDDQPGKLLSYEAILSGLGENLITAHSGREALDRLLKSDVAVVLMDVSMPELDGFELAEMIRQHPRFQDTAIIFISAVHLSDGDRLRGYAQGAVDYLSVPVVPELLRAKVSVFADRYRKSRQLEALNEELRSLSANLIAVQDNERRRIARELHDGLGQLLSAAKMMSDTVLRGDKSVAAKERSAAECSSLLEEALRQIRTISYLLHPPLLDEVGLQLALQSYVEGTSERSGLKAQVKFAPADLPRMAPELETALFRIVQEALTNVLRHSGADRASVELAHADNRLVLTIRDNGRGVSNELVQLRPGSAGIGIAGMTQRVKEFGGRIRLENVHPGCLVEVIIPLTEKLTFPPGIALLSTTAFVQPEAPDARRDAKSLE